ncbi:uncharacterized protein TNCV_1163171 [Trichonephila clavipes]|nr:uncharacterized protein TNCV_1163171 [Trichonephila clavipes]
MSLSCSSGERSGYPASQNKVSTFCRAFVVTKGVSDRSSTRTDVQVASQATWDNHEKAPAIKGNYFPDHNSMCRFNVSSALTWPYSNQHIAIPCTKQELTFIRKHKPPLCLLVNSSLTALTLQTTMILCQSKTCCRCLCFGAVLEETDL